MSYQEAMASETEPVSLDVVRARKFLHRLADDPFIALVVTDEGEVRIFSKGISEEHLSRIKEVLVQIQNDS